MKGHTNNPNGRKKGVPNKVTGSLREMINTFLVANWEQAQSDYKASEVKDRLAFYDKMLAYGLPKLAPEQTLIEPANNTSGPDFDKITAILQESIRREAELKRKESEQPGKVN